MSDSLAGYQPAELLGRGAFGSVYKALDLNTGGAVAIKQISLSNIPAAELPSIMSEIELLRQLNHKNVVRYQGSVKTPSHLFIILEYCENGSLHAICKKFGKFPESLVALYTWQALEGLVYLHDQGVIHRDIKAANILATKDGSVKLADFGVATRVNASGGAADETGIVGSPYWMAPEVIDQLGATAASDIWSLGATIVELFDGGRPPYYFLDPMPALFRIVNDDCPPIPDGASPPARDFLQRCFQKDPNLRVTARQLLSHAWIVAARTKLQATRAQRSSAAAPVAPHAETVQRVQEWNRKLEEPRRTAVSKPADAARGKPEDQVAQLLNREPLTERPLPAPVATPAVPLRTESADDDNWDDDFDGPIKAPVQRAAAAVDDFDGRTIRAKPVDMTTIRPLKPSVRAPVASSSRATPSSSRRKASDDGRTGLLHPRDIAIGVPPKRAERQAASLPSSSTTASLARWSEAAEEDYSDFEDDSTVRPTTRRVSKLRLRSPVNGADRPESDELDPFALLDDEGGSFEHSERDEAVRVAARIAVLVTGITPATDEDDLQEACAALIDLFVEDPANRRHFVRAHGILSILETLASTRSHEVTGALLRIINLVAVEADTLENLCLNGGCALVLKFTPHSYPHEIRLEAGLLISAMTRMSALTMQALLCSNALGTLVQLMTTTDRTERDVIWLSVDALCRIFEAQSSLPRSDLVRTLTRLAILTPLSRALAISAALQDDLARSATGKIVQILLVFAQSDLPTKEAVSSSVVVGNLLSALGSMPSDQLGHLIKVFRHLSSSSPAALSSLQSAGTIPALVRQLASVVARSELSSPIVGDLVGALYNLCRLNKPRQRIAAEAGAIGPLVAICRRDTPVRQLARPIICELAHGDAATRKLLWPHGGPQIYVELLADPYWAAPALEAIAAWLLDDSARVAPVLLQSSAVDALVHLLSSPQASSFEALLEPLPKVLRAVPQLGRTLGTRPGVAVTLAKRIAGRTKAVTRLQMLKLLKALLFDTGVRSPGGGRRVVLEQPVHAAISALAASDPAVLVRSLAAELLASSRALSTSSRVNAVHV